MVRMRKVQTGYNDGSFDSTDEEKLERMRTRRDYLGKDEESLDSKDEERLDRLGQEEYRQ